MVRRERIHELRTSKKMTLEELGEKVGVGKATIKKYESGVITNIPSDKIEALAEALGTTPSYIMGWASPNPDKMISALSQHVYNEKHRQLHDLVDRIPSDKEALAIRVLQQFLEDDQ